VAWTTSSSAAGVPVAGIPSCTRALWSHWQIPILAAPVTSSLGTSAVGQAPLLVAMVGDLGLATNSFSTMAMTPTITDLVADSDASNRTILDVGNLTTSRPFYSTIPSSIIVGNGYVLPVTSVGDTVLPNPFYLNNILLLLILFKIFCLLFVVLLLTTGVLSSFWADALHIATSLLNRLLT
jgi:hypothetical protein